MIYFQVTEIKDRFKSSKVEMLSNIQVTTIDSFQVDKHVFTIFGFNCIVSALII